MTFYHALGDSFELAAGEWLNLLAAAIRNGWQPSASEHPAVHFDIDVPLAVDTPSPGNTAYDLPVGQIMSSMDVRSLAHALREVVTTASATAENRLAEFCLFCETGGSVLLSAAAPPPSVVSVPPAPDTAQLLRLFRSLTADLDPSASQIGPDTGLKRENPEAHTIRLRLGK